MDYIEFRSHTVHIGMLTGSAERVLHLLLFKDLRPSEIARNTNLAKSTIFRALKQLTEMGYVARIALGRTVVYSITAKGISYLLNITQFGEDRDFVMTAAMRYLGTLGFPCEERMLRGIRFIKCSHQTGEFFVKLVPGLPLASLNPKDLEGLLPKKETIWGFAERSPLGHYLYLEKVSILNVLQEATEMGGKVLLLVVGDDPRKVSRELAELLNRAFDKSLERLLDLVRRAEEKEGVAIVFSKDVPKGLKKGLEELGILRAEGSAT